MKSIAIIALLMCGFLLRLQGWQLVSREQTRLGSLLVVGGTLVTLGIVAVLVAFGAP